MKKWTKNLGFIILTIILALSCFNLNPFQKVKAAETWSLAWSSSQGKAGTSKDNLSSTFALTNQTVGTGYTIYYAAPNYAKLDSIKLYKKNSDGSLTLKTNYDVTNATYQDHIWFSPTESGAYVLQGVWSEAINQITTKSKNIIGSIGAWESGTTPEKGRFTVRTKVVDAGSTNTIYYQAVPSGFAVGTGMVGHETDLKLTITYGDGTVETAYASNQGNGQYTYTLTNCSGNITIEAAAELEPTPNTTEIYVDGVLALDDSDIDPSLNYHINRMPVDSTMTYRVEKWIPNLKTGYRFTDLYRWELELSPAMEVTGYRFTTHATNPDYTTWKVDATGNLSKSNSYISYDEYGSCGELYEEYDYSPGSLNPIYFYNWDEDVIYPDTWVYNGKTLFSTAEFKNCKNNVHVFDFKSKNADYLYNTYLILEVDVKKKDNIDLSDSQYQYLGTKYGGIEKTHNFNGGYYFGYKSGAYQFTNRTEAIKQDGAHGLLKLQFDPAYVEDYVWIQKSHRWDYARDIFTVFQYNVTTKVKHGTISVQDYANSSVTATDTSFGSKITSVDAAHTATINYSPQDGYALKRISVDNVEIKESELNTYLNFYQFGAFNKDHIIEVEYVPAYTITTEVINGTIDPKITDIPEGANKKVGYSPNNGYKLSYVEIDGKRLTEKEIEDYLCQESYEWINIQADHHIKVVYEMAETSLTIKKRINQSQIYLESGTPTFIFEIKGTDYEGKSHTYYRTITFENVGTSGYVIKTVVLDGIPAGTYTIREIDTARYKCSVYARLNVTKIDDSTVTANTDVTNGGYNNCSVTFQNERSDYHDLDHTNIEINAFNVSN